MLSTLLEHSDIAWQIQQYEPKMNEWRECSYATSSHHHITVRFDVWAKANQRLQIQPGNSKPQGPLPGFFNTISTSSHDPLLVLPYQFADGIMVVRLDDILVGVIIPVVLKRNVHRIRYDRTLGRPRPQQRRGALKRRRRSRC